MILSWSAFLLSHPLRLDYDTNLPSLSNLFVSRDTVLNKFRTLTDNKSLVCLTRSPIRSETQATFFHHLIRDSIQQKGPHCYGLQGFGTRASAIRLYPDKVFAHTSNAKVIPTLTQLLDCETSEDLLALVEQLKSHTTPTANLPFFAILPPFLSDLLHQTESMDAPDILLQFTKFIKASNFDKGYQEANIPPAPEASVTITQDDAAPSQDDTAPTAPDESLETPEPQ